MKKSTTLTWVLIGLAIIIAAFPMFFNLGDPNSEEQFGGTDSSAESVVLATGWRTATRSRIRPLRLAGSTWRRLFGVCVGNLPRSE